MIRSTDPSEECTSYYYYYSLTQYLTLECRFILSTKDEIAHELKDNIQAITKESAKYGVNNSQLSLNLIQELKKTYEAKRDHYVKVLNDMSAKN